MRIIAGSRRGHRIAAPKGRETRPTSDRVRENAFNLIGPVDDAEVLDLFAGSGALGLEALSRGAARATFVENEREACRVIGANLEKLELRGIVICQDVLRAVAQEHRRYDLVLCDPPYDFDGARLAPHLARLLADDGVLVWETSGRLEAPEAPGLRQRTTRRYGSARLTLFETP
ncbi:MAG TPA: 16S rRNA (guanine(966)-N(2))-methyltransferase RsmD [Gaiellaceae bacterium]|nr:16S rRNA (guanine(966)-N(2))-methyltransferase RsmD [Gaiellaceae bacterium]